jgi:glycosyltransferase involved in cell wall biosynthesis
MIPQARQYNIPIYVSDNASTDHTIKVLESFQKDYPLLFFKSNKENVGVDQNMVNAALMASSKYIWTIGARRIILPGMLKKIYKILEESDWDLVVLNDLTSVFRVPKTQRYTSAQRVFMELNRNLTGLGFQILPAEAWKSESLPKYVGTEWTIIGLCLEYIAYKKNLNVYFLAEPCATDSGKSHWKPKCFQIWTKLKKVIRSLPEVYSAEDKERVIRNLANALFIPKFNIMGMGWSFSLVALRSERIYNSDVFDNYREDLAQYASYSPALAYVIAKFPIPPIRLYLILYDIVRASARLFIHTRVPINPRTRRNIPYSCEES